jgi:uncharacterized peroxidase-related enzyme
MQSIRRGSGRLRGGETVSFVTKITEERAGPELKLLYERVREPYGFLPNYFQALGAHPEVIGGHLVLGGATLRDGALPAALKEQILLVVSGINSSSYCIAAHLELLRKLGVEKALGRKLAVHYPSAPVGSKEMALFRLAEKLTRHPDDIEQTDVEAVRAAGWDEAALIETVLTAAWANFVNRVALGLGLTEEP